uniref:C2H2-type domain-containing protein n=1 Tax=Heterorhabditis bacteriophora TaxID=37862 RepID=A0A1I7WI47_HETBA
MSRDEVRQELFDMNNKLRAMILKAREVQKMRKREMIDFIALITKMKVEEMRQFILKYSTNDTEDKDNNISKKTAYRNMSDKNILPNIFHTIETNGHPFYNTLVRKNLTSFLKKKENLVLNDIFKDCDIKIMFHLECKKMITVTNEVSNYEYSSFDFDVTSEIQILHSGENRNTFFQNIVQILINKIVGNHEDIENGVISKFVKLVMIQSKYSIINETNHSEAARNLVYQERSKFPDERESKYLKTTFFNLVKSIDNIHHYLDTTYQRDNKAIKFNIMFGYVTERNNEVKLFKPGRNEYFFNKPVLMKNAEDLRSIKQKITQESITMHLSKSRPDSKTIILGVYGMGVKITRLDFPIGSNIQLPDYIKDSKSIVSLENVENNMRFFNCIALATGCRIDRYTKKSKEIFDKFYEKSIKRGKRKYDEYVGFDFVNELDHFEEIYTSFAVNIVTCYPSSDEKQQEISISYIRKSKFNEERRPIYLNLYLDHFSYITDLKKLSKLYICNRCGFKCRDNHNLQRHIDSCQLEQIDVFPKYPKLWNKKRNLIVELSDYYDIVVDFSKHTPVSVSITSNVPEFENEKFILSENPRELIKQMFEYFDKVSEEAGDLMTKKMKPLLDKLEDMGYCAAGTTLEGLFKAYDVGEQKGWFPYEWFDSYEKLDFPTKDLKIKDFYSSLKNKHMKEEDFTTLMKICNERRLTKVRNLLEWYNNLDVRPLLKACLKQKEFFYNFKLDMYKDAVSLPGLSEHILYQFQIQGFEEYLKKTSAKTSYTLNIDEDILEKRFITIISKIKNQIDRQMIFYKLKTSLTS